MKVGDDRPARDYGDKFAEYEAASVREYWLFDPAREDAAIWALNAQGCYRTAWS